MTPFHGWEMPLYYTSILDEHKSVRTAVGLFDVSHMGQLFVTGPGAVEAVNELIVSDLAQTAVGRACYTMLLNQQGGILDDIIVFRVGETELLVVINCANRQKDVAWFQSHAAPPVQVGDHSAARSIIAIQGPQAAGLLGEIAGLRISALGRFDVMAVPGLGLETWVSRTGYTGSDGFEVFLPNRDAIELWRRLLERGQAFGVQPIGLGARDTLRLEAGLRLCGTDMDETTTPFEADLGWTVALGKASFIGKAALARQKAAGAGKRLCGFQLEQGPVPRQGCPLLIGERTIGTVTSGTFSLMLNKPIGLAYVERDVALPGTAVQVAIRAKSYPATIVKLPFWRTQTTAATAQPTGARA